MGLTRPRAYQIFDIDYKQSVRVVTVSNVTLSGGAPSQVDGVSLSLNDRVLVTAQTTGSQNGLYYVTTVGTGSNGTWARSVDGNETGEIDAGMIVMVTEGTTYADTQWKLTTNDPIVIGTTALTFVQNYSANSISSGTSNVTVTSNANVSIGVAGSNVAVFTAGGPHQFTGNLNPTSNVTYSLGNATSRWKDIYLANNSIYLGNVTLSADATQLLVNSANVVTSTGGAMTLTGNVTGGNINTDGQVVATGNVTGGNLVTAGQISATGTITSNGATNSTAFAVGNSAVSNVALGFFPTAGTAAAMAIRDYSTVASTIYFDVGMGGSAAGDFKFRTTNAFSTIMTANTAGITTPGTVYGLELSSTQSSGDEGGQINLAKPATNSTLAGGVIVDVYQNKLRFFENGGTARGAYIDITAAAAGVGTNLLAGSGGTPGGSNTYVQFNDASTFGGNAQFTYDKVTNTLTAGIIASTNNGNGTNFRVGDDAYLGDINTADTISLRGLQNAANGYIVFGNADSTQLGRAGSGPLTYGGAFTATGNISGSYFIGNGYTITSINASNVSGTVANATYATSAGSATTATSATTAGTVTTAAQPNITSVGTLSSLAVTANITGGNLITAGILSVNSGNAATAIVNAGGNGVGNIGSSTTYFNTVFAKATSAQYADLAEMYEADGYYPPGHVVVFGGDKEITLSTKSHDTAVAGIISTNPSYLMNATHPGEFVLAVALTGRVPCLVQGPVNKGDVLVTGSRPGTAQRIGTNWQPGCTVGKAMESINTNEVQVIEVAVGRL